MKTPADTMDLRELAARSGVSVRTVRFYQQQSLLHSPGQRGPGARYSAADLDRLRLIRMLQAEHLPLVEIKKRLDVMSDASVSEAIALGQLPIERSSAAEYARMVLQSSMGGRGQQHAAPPDLVMGLYARVASSSQLSDADASFAGDLQEHVESSSLSLGNIAMRDMVDTRMAGQSWVRMTLAPNIELNVRHPLSNEEHRLVERLLAAVHRDPNMEELP